MTLLTTREALAPLRGLIAQSAIGARARGDADEERRYLDAQILLDRLPVVDAATLADDEALLTSICHRQGLSESDGGIWYERGEFVAVTLRDLAAALSEPERATGGPLTPEAPGRWG